MEVKPGYKQTEVGVIPEEWKVKPLGELFNFSGGYPASRDQLSLEGHCYLHYGDIHGATKTTVNVLADFQNIPKLDIPLKRVASKSLLEDGDVVFVDASEDDEGTSRHVVVVNKDKKPFISGLHTIVAKSKTDDLTHEYRRYCFQTASIRRQFLFYAVGTKVTGISKNNIPKLLLPIPKPPEQRAIAEALSHADGLLGGLDQLIAKKRDLKQAAMQQLVTGQTRLPDFRGEWAVVDFESLCRSFTKQTGFDYTVSIKPSLTFEDTTTSLPFIQNKDFSGKETNYETDYFVPESIAINFPEILLDERCLLISISGRVGNVGVFSNTRKAFVGGAVAVSKFRNPNQLDWVMYYFQSQAGQNELLGNVKAGSHQNLILEDLRKIEIPLPSLEEQEAITAALSDMDAELAALEQRREKTRALKQAMMQELLTGRTRLVARAGADHAEVKT